MPFLTSDAFDIFQSQQVDLEPVLYSIALHSMTTLHFELHALARHKPHLPYVAKFYQPLEAIANKTQIQPLETVSFLYVMDYHPRNLRIERTPLEQLTVRTGSGALVHASYLHPDETVNSLRVMERLMEELPNLPAFEVSELHSTQDIILLALTPYEWVFKVVPAFSVQVPNSKIPQYLVPDGHGYWRHFNPRPNIALMANINKRHEGKFAEMLRLLHYWNNNYNLRTRFDPYHLDVILANAYQDAPAIVITQAALQRAFRVLSDGVMQNTTDVGGTRVDTYLDQFVRSELRDVTRRMSDLAGQATMTERSNNHPAALKTWGEIFPDFPTYGLDD